MWVIWRFKGRAPCEWKKSHMVYPVGTPSGYAYMAAFDGDRIMGVWVREDEVEYKRIG